MLAVTFIINAPKLSFKVAWKNLTVYLTQKWCWFLGNNFEKNLTVNLSNGTWKISIPIWQFLKIAWDFTDHFIIRVLAENVLITIHPKMLWPGTFNSISKLYSDIFDNVYFSGTVGTFGCHGQGGNQFFELNSKQELRYTSQFELCISIKNGEPTKVGAIDCSDDKRTTPSTAKWQTIENQSAGSFQLKNR